MGQSSRIFRKTYMIELREYQKIAVEKALDFLKNGDPKDKPIVVAPTGAGKSIYVAHIARKLGRGVLVFQPSKELLEQNYGKFRMYGGTASIYSASMGSKEISDVTFATIGSVKGKSDDFTHVKYVIIDECHTVPPVKQSSKSSGSMYMNFLQELPGVKVIGLTATPFRLKKYRDPWTRQPFAKINLLNRERPMFFNKFLHVTQISELTALGFLSPIRYISLSWNDAGLKVNTTGAEYTDKSIKDSLDNDDVIKKLPDIIKQSIEKGRKYRLVFVFSVMDAQLLAKRVPNSAYVCAETPADEREQIIKDFRAGKIGTIFNVNILTIGFDFPELDTIILARPTMSLTLYMQMIGRGVRPHESKEDCVLLDMCGNIKRFSKFEDIKYVNDPKEGWIIHDGIKQLSGVKLA